MTTTQTSATTENRSRRQAVRQNALELLAFTLAIAGGVVIEIFVFDLLSGGPRLSPTGTLFLGLVVAIPVAPPLIAVWKHSIRDDSTPDWFKALLTWTAATIILALEVAVVMLLGSSTLPDLVAGSPVIAVIATVMSVPAAFAFLVAQTSVFATGDSAAATKSGGEVSDGG